MYHQRGLVENTDCIAQEGEGDCLPPLRVGITSPNRTAVAEPRLKMWDKMWDKIWDKQADGRLARQTDRQMDGQTDRVFYRVALLLKMLLVCA